MITEQQPGISTKTELYEILEQIDKSDEPRRGRPQVW